MARLPTSPRADSHYRLVGATLFDGTSADPLADAEVEVARGRIVYVGRRRRRDPAGVTAIDVSGGYLTPGFIDTHVHLSMSTDVPTEQQRSWFPEEHVIAALGNLHATVDAGVTTARDLSGLTPGYRSSIAAGSIIGPRLHLAIAMLSPTGGHADPVMANGSLPLWAERATTPGWAVVDTIDDVVKSVRALVRTGADVIKVCTSGGMSSPHDDPADRGLPLEHVAAIVAELGGRQGQPVAAHAQNDAGAQAAVLGGATSIEHGYDLSESTVASMIERGTFLVPTLSTLLRTGWSAAEEDPRRARAITSIRDALSAGVRVALGTDAGIHTHGRNLVELSHLVRAGLSPLEALRAGTLGGAELMGLDGDVGSIEVGKVADLVLIKTDPMSDIAALGDPRSIRLVVQAGRAVKDVDDLYPSFDALT
ncbi:imidazolonepropionase-like amidohydrolase [Microbacterium endophyticum]|uniref:Imidazolonepropionase-like amidohydrolase n=1 Tax=Microbacterium endophyticum TaxID=1526412 RepID=A0A7W4YMR1_9MICO|nr:amidohydrolase family protein [Microbacterium endophyticum]MBB2975367.1 imidazolonepropionase-like amidohydrolase [Microbacterium endophyticum]NIK35614.1 imidazolonepropionase-like amidohydrolase [Microbacterium endophyticum]